MKRKVNKSGPNTLIVSLPSKWVKENNVHKGDELELTPKNKQLIVSTETCPRKRSIMLNIEGLDKLNINRFMDEFYRQGFDQITLQFKKDTVMDYRAGKEILVSQHVKKLSERYIGLEIVSKTTNSIQLRALSNAGESNKLELIQQRVFFLIKEFLEEFVNSMDGDFNRFHAQIDDYHDNIVKFINYYQRLLYISDLDEGVKSRLFGLFIIIDKMIDKLRHTSRRVHTMKKITKRIKKDLKDLFDFFLGAFVVLQRKDYNFEELNNSVQHRYKLLHRVIGTKYTEDELRVIGDAKVLLDTNNNFAEAYVALHMEEFVDHNYQQATEVCV